MSISVFIIDDEGPVRRELTHHLSRMEDVVVVGEAASAAKAMPGMRALAPDLVFLDVRMPGLSGLELAYLLGELPRKPLLVFVTAYEEHAVKAFELDALDYILKPFTRERLERAVDKARRALGVGEASGRIAPASRTGSALPGVEGAIPAGQTGSPRPSLEAAAPGSPAELSPPANERRIPLYDGERIVPTHPKHIFHVASLEGRIVVAAVHGRYTARSTLAELEARLLPHGFFRAHRSHLVNLNHVAEIIPWSGGSYKLVMSDRERSEIMVSRYNVKELKEYFDL
jgi:DNA-binding LytR/AlgR family response regulator